MEHDKDKIILIDFCGTMNMINKKHNVKQAVGKLYNFVIRVACAFTRNHGLLLSGAVAYYTLLSIVPMSILSLVVLTHYMEEQLLIHTLSAYLEMVIPGYASNLIEHVRAFLKHRNVIGMIGFIVMLFFSSITFSTIETAIDIIFSRKSKNKRRNFFVSAIIPYGYIFFMGLGIVIASVIVGEISTLENRQLTFLGFNLNFSGAAGVAMQILGIIGEVLIFSSIYLVMPAVQVKFRYALIGGVTATVLWEITRRVLVWYYATVSMVNVIYGSIAIAVAALLSIEAVAIILLLGAQVIAELEHKPE